MNATKKKKKKTYDGSLASHNSLRVLAARSFPTIFLKCMEQNYFLFPYKKTHHNIFPYISLYQLNTLSLPLFYYYFSLSYGGKIKVDMGHMKEIEERTIFYNIIKH
jgi:hypothetical protein